MGEKSDLEKLVNILTLISAIIAPIIGGGITFFDTNNPVQSIKTSGLILLVVFVGWFALKVMEKTVERWVGRSADVLDNWFQSLVSGFRKKYFRHLVFRHRDFDVKGLSTQGVFTLELERIFVELTVSPQAYHRVSSNILATSPENLPKGSHVVWDFLTSRDQAGRKLVILGAPGSGKTTLLKNIALVLAGAGRSNTGNKAGNRLPVLLYLREHADAIAGNANIRLPEVIQMSLEKYQITPPPKWFDKYLKAGSCIVMLDGLDEVAEADVRKKVVAWVEKQIVSYPKNHFIVTSRPFGYRENQLNGVDVLEVLPFNIRQVKQFIDNWYLANEIHSHQKNDEGVRIKAKEGAEDLFTRLRKTPILLDLAVNPLLLTMIATVHRYRSSLPGRRVELYREICEVFLGKRQSARGMDLLLTPAQKQSILQPLAYHMMQNHIREIPRREALAVFADRLRQVSPQNTGEEFLQMVENLSGLLLERENGVYGFAHKTFQEYLASVYVIEQGLEQDLVTHIEDSWWHECIRLYAAQANATVVIEACIAEDPPSASALTLAIACEDEAREVHPDTRHKLEVVLLEGVESKNPESRRIIAEALLTLNVRDMTRIDDNVYIGRRLINHAEFQLFVDEMTAQKKVHQPDHWQGKDFPPGKGLEPVVGVRAGAGSDFCDWLTQRENGEWRFRFPSQNEISLSNTDMPEHLNYWVAAGIPQNKTPKLLKAPGISINPKIYEFVLSEDLKVARYMDRLLGLDITRTLILAGPMINQILKYVSHASYHDLGGSGLAFDDTDWAKASSIARIFSDLVKDASQRMHGFGARLISANVVDASLALAHQIHDARDILRSSYVPGAYAPDRANKSAIAAENIKRTAQNLTRFTKHLDADIAGAKNLNAAQIKKIAPGVELNMIEITNFIVTMEPARLATIMDILKEKKNCSFMDAIHMDLSDFPQLERITSILLKRIPAVGVNSVDIRKLTLCYLRLFCIHAIKSIRFEQRLPNLLAKDKTAQQVKKSDGQIVMDKIKELYAMLVVLEARAQNILPPTESLRIVRERVNISI